MLFAWLGILTAHYWLSQSATGGADTNLAHAVFTIAAFVMVLAITLTTFFVQWSVPAFLAFLAVISVVYLRSLSAPSSPPAPRSQGLGAENESQPHYH
jgi:hypothetical protein